jgi:[ribosomal protein S18]-alanine N-acetyltransferase
MSAQIDNLPRFRRMAADDLDRVMAIEAEIYAHPWTRGNFSDSQAAAYHCWIMEVAGETVGYSVVMIAAGEAHLLNLGIASDWQRRGLGSELLGFVIKLARDFSAEKMFLEVRPSNNPGRRLYARAGFAEIATRRNYYPDGKGREDAVILELAL